MSLVRAARLSLATLVVVGVTAWNATGQDALDDEKTWPELATQGYSVAFGRFEGQFEGPLFRSKRLRLEADGGKNYYLPVRDGLGYFEVLLPPGVYRLAGLEANYVPMMRPMNMRNYRPVHQKFGIRSEAGQVATFRVLAERPVYLGTLQTDASSDGLVYQGRLLRVRDEFGDTLERFQRQFPRVAASLIKAGANPIRQFFLKPTIPTSNLELIGTEDPIRKAREYIADGKFDSAVNWLTTFMPSSEVERRESRLLIGEAFLADDRYDDAIEKLGAVLLEDPENLRALRLLARAHALSGNQDDALALFEALAQAKPGDAEAQLQRGYIYALRAEHARSADAFTSAFKNDQEYLLHDVLPFAVALNAVKSKTASFEPARMIRQTTPPPPSALRSRRSSEQSGMAIVIDHTGKVVAARMGPDSSGPEPVLLVSVIRAIFKPAELNGIPVPSILAFGGTGPRPSQ